MSKDASVAWMITPGEVEAPPPLVRKATWICVGVRMYSWRTAHWREDAAAMDRVAMGWKVGEVEQT